MGKDLGLAGQPAEGARVDDAGPVALKRRAVGVCGLLMGALSERVSWVSGDGTRSERLRRNAHAFWFTKYRQGHEVDSPACFT